MFYISPYYLSRTFKEGTGFNMINYLNYIRVKNAKVLLDGTSRAITDISQEVGFESTTHFDRVFKEIEGISPLKYRKQKGTSEFVRRNFIF
ncbi:MAG: helix-turn-helix transcriptional regulator [Cellulosilyticaceae bacterium]